MADLLPCPKCERNNLHMGSFSPQDARNNPHGVFDYRISCENCGFEYGCGYHESYEQNKAAAISYWNDRNGSCHLFSILEDDKRKRMIAEVIEHSSWMEMT